MVPTPAQRHRVEPEHIFQRWLRRKLDRLFVNMAHRPGQAVGRVNDQERPHTSSNTFGYLYRSALGIFRRWSCSLTDFERVDVKVISRRLKTAI